jgi:hypothetical protein
MVARKFTKNKTYYLRGENWKLKFIDQNLEGYNNFKVTEHNDLEDNWVEYSTKDGSEILSDRKEWMLTIKKIEKRA